MLSLSRGHLKYEWSEPVISLHSCLLIELRLIIGLDGQYLTPLIRYTTQLLQGLVRKRVFQPKLLFLIAGLFFVFPHLFRPRKNRFWLDNLATTTMQCTHDHALRPVYTGH